MKRYIRHPRRFSLPCSWSGFAGFFRVCNPSKQIRGWSRVGWFSTVAAGLNNSLGWVGTDGSRVYTGCTNIYGLHGLLHKYMVCFINTHDNPTKVITFRGHYAQFASRNKSIVASLKLVQLRQRRWN